jgi:cell division protein FtsQ
MVAATARRRLPRLRLRTWGVLVVLLAAAGFGGWLWLRDSSLVRVQQVTITGATGAEAPQIERALTTAAREMTTLHLDAGRLRTAVALYPQVKALRTTARPLHRLDIQVIERPPVAALTVGEQRTPIAADGTLLKGRVSDAGLPAVRVTALPGGGRLTGGPAARALTVVAAAPSALRRHVERIDWDNGSLVAQMEDGPRVLLGDVARPRAKWVAAARVLSDAGSAQAAYVDVRLPERPVVGGFATDAPPVASTSTGG